MLAGGSVNGVGASLEGFRSLHGYTGLSDRELVEVDRFATRAALYVLAGVPVTVAWTRANEWLEEHPEPVALEVETDVEDDDEASGAGDSTRPIRTSRAAEGPESRATSPSAKEVGMTFKDTVLEGLTKAGNATAAELAHKLGADGIAVANALRSLLGDGRVNRHGGHKGASWEVGTGKSTRDEERASASRAPAPARRAPAARKSPPPAASRGSWLDELRAERDRLQAKVERMSALLEEFAS